jgi:hypothetical protein
MLAICPEIILSIIRLLSYRLTEAGLLCWLTAHAHKDIPREHSPSQPAISTWDQNLGPFTNVI